MAVAVAAVDWCPLRDEKLHCAQSPLQPGLACVCTALQCAALDCIASYRTSMTAIKYEAAIRPMAMPHALHNVPRTQHREHQAARADSPPPRQDATR